MGIEQVVTNKAAKICREKSTSGFEPWRSIRVPCRNSCDWAAGGGVKSEPLGVESECPGFVNHPLPAPGDSKMQPGLRAAVPEQ